MVVYAPLGCDFLGSLLNPRQKSLAHLDQMARKYADKVFGGQYLMASLAKHSAEFDLSCPLMELAI